MRRTRTHPSASALCTDAPPSPRSSTLTSPSRPCATGTRRRCGSPSWRAWAGCAAECAGWQRTASGQDRHPSVLISIPTYLKTQSARLRGQPTPRWPPPAPTSSPGADIAPRSTYAVQAGTADGALGVLLLLLLVLVHQLAACTEAAHKRRRSSRAPQHSHMRDSELQRFPCIRCVG